MHRVLIVCLLASLTLSASAAHARTAPPGPELPAPATWRPATLLILPFKHDAGEEAERTAHLIGDLVAAAAERASTYKVVTGADLQNVADLESQRQVAGCDESSSSCLAELAGAMGAEMVLFGNVGRLGDTIIVSLNLFNSDRAQSAGRQTVRVANLNDLPDAIDAAVGLLLTPPAQPLPLATIAGAMLVSVGVGVGAVGMVLAGGQNEVLASATSSGDAKGQAFLLGHVSLWGGFVAGLGLVGGGLAVLMSGNGEG